MKIKATVYGKKDCSLCDNRKENLKRFPSVFKKKTGEDLEVDLVYYDIGTVDGLVEFCKEERVISEIPVVILEDEKGSILKIYAGPKDTVSSRNLSELLIGVAED